VINHISYSSLKDWHNCPYSFKLIHIDKLYKFKGNIHTTFGSAMHKLIECQIKGNLKDDTFDNLFLQELKELSREEIKINKQFIKEMRVQGKTIIPQVLTSVEKYFGEGTEIINIEEPLMENITDFETKIKFKGFIDIIFKTKDGVYHIADWKTTSWGWDAMHKGNKIVTYQLTLYKRFYAQKQNIDLSNIETHFILLKRTAPKKKVEPFRVTSGQKKINNALEFLRIAVVNIEKGNFIKKKSNCENCVLQKEKICI